MKSPPVQPHSSSATLIVARVMLGHGCEPGMGLGRNRNGIARLVEFAKNRGRFWLGYEPTRAEKRRIALERKERSSAQPQGLQVERVPFCHIDESFISAGWICEGQVAVINKETP